MNDKKQKNSVIMAIIAVVFLVLLAALYIATSTPKTATESGEGAPSSEEASAQQEQQLQQQIAERSVIDVDTALSDRILGDVNAPLKIVEFASLTCSHCGEFHKNTFAQVRDNYISTGKAYLVFSDFPLNGPALHASMIARCMPQERYFHFLNLLFQRQEEWAYSADYQGWLKARAIENGMYEETFDACIANKELEEGIKNRMKTVQEQWNISSTPSFVLNDKTVLAGAYPYESFSKSLDEALTNAGAEAPEPAASEEEAVTEEAPAAEEEVAPPAEDTASEEAAADEEPAAEEPASEEPVTEETPAE